MTESRAHQLLRQELWPRESVLWIGQSAVGRLVRRYVGTLLFSEFALLAAFAVLQPTGARDTVDVLGSALPVVLIGSTAALAVLGVGLGYWYARRLVYMVTDRRIMAFVGLGGRLEWVGRKGLIRVDLRLNKDGTGDLTVWRRREVLEALVAVNQEEKHESLNPLRDPAAGDPTTAETHLILMGVKEPKTVFGLIRDAFGLAAG